MFLCLCQTIRLYLFNKITNLPSFVARLVFPKTKENQLKSIGFNNNFVFPNNAAETWQHCQVLQRHVLRKRLSTNKETPILLASLPNLAQFPFVGSQYCYSPFSPVY